jgi:hypothetical protein
VPLVHAYLDLIECSGATRDVLNCYLDLVRLRASGELQTAAQWMRGFVTGHKDYQKDSVITPSMNDDLIEACLAISDGTLVRCFRHHHTHAEREREQERLVLRSRIQLPLDGSP